MGRFQIYGVNDGAAHQGTEYRTSCRGVGKSTVRGKSVLWDILSVRQLQAFRGEDTTAQCPYNSPDKVGFS